MFVFYFFVVFCVLCFFFSLGNACARIIVSGQWPDSAVCVRPFVYAFVFVSVFVVCFLLLFFALSR